MSVVTLATIVSRSLFESTKHSHQESELRTAVHRCNRNCLVAASVRLMRGNALGYRPVLRSNVRSRGCLSVYAAVLSNAAGRPDPRWSRSSKLLNLQQEKQTDVACHTTCTDQHFLNIFSLRFNTDLGGSKFALLGSPQNSSGPCRSYGRFNARCLSSYLYEIHGQIGYETCT